MALCFSFICLSGFNVFVGSVCLRTSSCRPFIFLSFFDCLFSLSFFLSFLLFSTFLLSLFLLVSSVCLPYLYLPFSFLLFVLSHIRPSCFSSLYIRLSYLFPSLTFSVTSVLLSLLSDVRLSQLKLPESQIFSPPLFNSSSFRGDCVGGGDHYSTLTC